MNNNQTVAEKLATDERNVKITKMVSRRFPDAELHSGRWVSHGVTVGNAQGLVLLMSGSSYFEVELFVNVKSKGQEVKVWSRVSYRLTLAHIQGFVQRNAKRVIEDDVISGALLCQE